jgi:hypothetical protein
MTTATSASRPPPAAETHIHVYIHMQVGLPYIYPKMKLNTHHTSDPLEPGLIAAVQADEVLGQVGRVQAALVQNDDAAPGPPAGEPIRINTWMHV